jgi:hypothetical protein
MGDTHTVYAQLEEQPVVPAKRRYRRHPKPESVAFVCLYRLLTTARSANAPEKPASAYVVFSNGIRAELKGSKSFSELARIVGERWKALEPQHKEVRRACCAILSSS